MLRDWTSIDHAPQKDEALYVQLQPKLLKTVSLWEETGLQSIVCHGQVGVWYIKSIKVHVMTLWHHLPLILQSRVHRRRSSSCFTFSTTYFLMFHSAMSRTWRKRRKRWRTSFTKYAPRFFDVMGKYQWALANPSPGRIPEAIQTLPEDTLSMSPRIHDRRRQRKDHCIHPHWTMIGMHRWKRLQSTIYRLALPKQYVYINKIQKAHISSNTAECQ